MAINSVQPTTPFEQIARSLVDRFDANKDGQLTTEEFTAFLSNFMTSAGTPNQHASQAAVAAQDNGLKLGTVKPKMLGFDTGKMADPTHDSVKSKFARVAKQYSIEGVTSKDAAEQLLNTMKGDLEAAGLNVLDIKNDKIKIRGDQGQDLWVDVLKAVGSGQAKSWIWLSERA